MSLIRIARSSREEPTGGDPEQGSGRIRITKTPQKPVRSWVHERGVLRPATHSTTKRSDATRPSDQPSKSPLIGRTAFFKREGSEQTIAGVVRSLEGSQATVSLALPNADGVLVMSQDANVIVPKEDLQIIDAVTVTDRDVKFWESQEEVSGVKAAQEIREEPAKPILDYVDVTFEGFASTFQTVTPEDRDGDYILDDAFDKFLPDFKDNPVMLTDHIRSVKNLMGHYDNITVLKERGLALRGIVTNSPHPDAKHVRFSIMEGSLKTLSIGGLFFYLDDFKGIEEIRLHEVSLVVIPANPDATFIVRALTGDQAEKMFKEHLKKFGGELRASIKLKN